MSAGDEGLVYEIHFDEPIGDPDNPKGQAQHYIGHTEDLYRRLREHRGGRTAAIMRAVNEAGIGWRVVRTWPGTRDTERAIKDLRSGRRLCPECTEHPLTAAGAIARAAALRRHREAQAARAQRQAARLEAQRAEQARQREAARAAAKADPYEDGRRMARQWLAQQDEAGRTAGQIEAAHEYVTGPWAEMAHHTEDQAERYRGYTELVRAALAEFREMEAEADPAGPAGSEMEERMQEQEQEYDADGNAARARTMTWTPASTSTTRVAGWPATVTARSSRSTPMVSPGREASPDDGRPVAEAESDRELGGVGQALMPSTTPGTRVVHQNGSPGDRRTVARPGRRMWTRRGWSPRLTGAAKARSGRRRPRRQPRTLRPGPGHTTCPGGTASGWPATGSGLRSGSPRWKRRLADAVAALAAAARPPPGARPAGAGRPATGRPAVAGMASGRRGRPAANPPARRPR